MGVTNQEFINRAALNHQPGPGEHDPRNDVLTGAKRAEEAKHIKYDATCAATGSHLSPFALETTGGHGASTATVYFLFAKQLRDSGLPADVVVGKLNKARPVVLPVVLGRLQRLAQRARVEPVDEQDAPGLERGPENSDQAAKTVSEPSLVSAVHRAGGNQDEAAAFADHSLVNAGSGAVSAADGAVGEAATAVGEAASAVGEAVGAQTNVIVSNQPTSDKPTAGPTMPTKKPRPCRPSRPRRCRPADRQPAHATRRLCMTSESSAYKPILHSI
jgi:hypothetical protein